MEARPTTAFGLSIAAGVLIVVGSFLFLLIGFGFFSLFALLGLIFGTIVLVGSILLYARPREHVAWGVIVLIFSALSLVGFGGFLIGAIIGIIGGAIGVGWQPGGSFAASSYGGAHMGPYGVPVMPWRMCIGCGRWIPWSYNVCPLCGTQAPIASWVPRAVEPAVQSPDASPYPSPSGLTGAPAPQAYPNPTPAPPAKAPCPTCEGDAEWSPAYHRWFCPAEGRYF